jgi:hypothetical protein
LPGREPDRSRYAVRRPGPGSSGRCLRPSKIGGRVKNVIVTLGGEGLVIKSDDTISPIAAKRVKVVSSHGAGDCFVGALAAKIATPSRASISVMRRGIERGAWAGPGEDRGRVVTPLLEAPVADRPNWTRAGDIADAGGLDQPAGRGSLRRATIGECAAPQANRVLAPSTPLCHANALTPAVPYAALHPPLSEICPPCPTPRISAKTESHRRFVGQAAGICLGTRLLPC